jgi:tRNA threonylcarbamoyladenosine biosynthesis protein TsaB
MALLAHAGVTLPEIDVYAVATGPGSFTGLRVGIAAMQGLAFAGHRPLVGVSALDALALVADAPRVVAWIDAWRGEVYSARYETGRAIEPPVVARPQDVLAALDERPTRFIGDGAGTYRTLIERTRGHRAGIADPVSPPLAGVIAGIATDRARSGHLPPPHLIQPLYVRRADAELGRDRVEAMRPAP